MNFSIDTSHQLSPSAAENIVDTTDITDPLGIDLNESDLRLDSDGEHGDLFNDETNELSDLLPKLPMDINVLFGKSLLVSKSKSVKWIIHKTDQERNLNTFFDLYFLIHTI